MISNKLDRILFLDIETVPEVYRYNELNQDTKDLWDEKLHYQSEYTGLSTAELYEKSGVLAEFAKIICISVGVIRLHDNEAHFYSKTFAKESEKELLNELADLLKSKTHDYALCAHNGKEFDFPFICRRMLIHGVSLPQLLQLSGKKPWEVNHLDTMEMWKFGDRKHFTSLKLLAHLFNIPSPKDDISGKDVARVYWEEKDLERIARYCQKDVLTLAQLLLRWQNMALIKPGNVHELV